MEIGVVKKIIKFRIFFCNNYFFSNRIGDYPSRVRKREANPFRKQPVRRQRFRRPKSPAVEHSGKKQEKKW